MVAGLKIDVLRLVHPLVDHCLQTIGRGECGNGAALAIGKQRLKLIFCREIEGAFEQLRDLIEPDMVRRRDDGDEKAGGSLQNDGLGEPIARYVARLRRVRGRMGRLMFEHIVVDSPGVEILS